AAALLGRFLPRLGPLAPASGPFFWQAEKLLSRGPVRPQLLQGDLTKAPRQGLHILRQTVESRRTLILAFIHVEGTVDLKLNGVKPDGRVAVVFGDEAAGVWLVAADGVAERPQSFLDGLRHHADAACAVAISEHELWSRPLIPMAGRRWHRMAIDQHGRAEFAMQTGKEPAQGAMIRLVEAFNALQGIIDRNALVIDFLRVSHHARHRSQAASDTHRTRIGERRQPAVEHAWIKL